MKANSWVENKLLSLLSRLPTKEHIFIACTPKSGSSFLMRLLNEIINGEIVIFHQAFDRTEQDINLLKVIENINRRTTTHQHIRCTNYNLSVLKRARIKPLILTRDVFDSIISLYDHIHNEPEVIWWPMAYVDDSFYSMEYEEKINYIIDMMIPWYFNFYVSWYKYASNNELLWLTYEEIYFDNFKSCIEKILNYYSIHSKVSEEIILSAREKVLGQSRFNVGIVGRGNKLKEYQKDAIRKYASYYKNVDFSKIGL